MSLVGSFRSAPRFVFVSFRLSSRHVCSWGDAPFFSARFLVSSCHERAFPGGGVVLRPGLSSRWGVSFRLSSRPSARPGVSGFLSSRPVVSLVVSQGVSCLPVVLVSLSALALSAIAHRVRASPSHLVVGIGRGVSLKRLGPSLVSCSIPIRAVFPSSVSRRGEGVDCPGHRWGVAWPSSFPCVLTSLIALRLQSARIGVPLVGSFVGPFVSSVWRLVSPDCARLCCPRLVRMAWSCLFLFIRAVFVSSISHWLLIVIVVGGVRANRLTGHRGHRPFHMGHQGERNWQRRRGIRRNDGRRWRGR